MTMSDVTFKINNMEITVPEGITVLEAARRHNIDIPTLCNLKDVNEIGACRMCMVEVAGAKALQAACVYPVAPGIEVFTNTPRARKARRVNLELILSNHHRECTTCIRSENCELPVSYTHLRSKVPGEELLEMAEDIDMLIMTTDYPLFESCGILYHNGLKGAIPKNEL